MASAVVVDGLVKRYGALTAVDQATFAAPKAQVTALLGPNGAGKTSTVETCEGYRKPDGGQVRVLGLDPIKDGPRLKPQVGVMLQDGGGYPGAHTKEMLELVASFAADPLPVEPLMERLGLHPVARTPYRRLSGGERQRLSLAMALVGRPQLVFLDEPTAGLDPQARRTTWALIEELRADGVTVVLTTHAMDEAERLADHVVVINHGRVIASGTPKELTTSNPTLRFRAQPGLDVVNLSSALPANTSVVEETPGRYVAIGEANPQLVAAITNWCAQHEVMLEEIGTSRRTLEDVFFQLTDEA